MEASSESGSGTCSIALDMFEGPLDLLLHLVKTHELDILDIPISFVAKKYLEYLEFARVIDFEVAGEYLVMAATLAYLKSRELVPKQAVAESSDETSAEAADPRQALIDRLIEYQSFQRAAEELNELPQSGRDVFGRGSPVDLVPLDTGLSPVTLFRLAEAFQRVLARAKIHKSHEVVLESVSIGQRMHQLSLLLDETGRFEFEAVFLGRTWASEIELRRMLVVTLMSILELTKLGITRVHQPEDSETIVIERASDCPSARERLEAYEKEALLAERPDPVGRGTTPPSGAEDPRLGAAASEGNGASLTAPRERSSSTEGSNESEEGGPSCP